MKAVVIFRNSCQVMGTALLVAVAPLTLQIRPAQAQIDEIRAQKERRAAEEAAQRAREREARRLVESILNLREEFVGRALDPGFRQTVKRRLLGVPIDILREIEWHGGEGDVRAVISASAESEASLESADEDLLLLPLRVAEPNAVSGVAQTGHVFVPVTPCRLADTRISAEGALIPGLPRPLVVGGSDAGLFEVQGGNPSGCGVPAGTATAAFVNVVAVSPDGPGNLRAWAYDPSLPLQPFASIINYAAVPGGLNIANGITAPLCDPLATTCTYDLFLQANISTVHMVADVLGYFRPAPTSFVTIGRSSATTTVGSSCTHYAGAVVGIDVPAPGKVLVRANVQLRLSHTAGLPDFVVVGIGASPADCSSPFGDATFVSTVDLQPTGFYYPTIPISRLFTVSTPGTYFYYVNGYASSPLDDSFWYAGLQATYHPD